MSAKAIFGPAAPFLIVRDVLVSVEFYTTRLGFEVRSLGPEGDPFFAIVGRDDCQILLKAITPEVQSEPNRFRHEWAQWDVFVFVPDPDAVARDFRSRGTKLTTGVGETEDHLYGLEVTDPDEYLLFFGRPIFDEE